MSQSVKILFSAGALLLSAIGMPAEGRQLSESEALTRAERFVGRADARAGKKAIDQSGLKLAYVAQNQGVNYFYVFNKARSGFMIVGADDRLPAVLAYSDAGTLDMTDLPDNLKYWLGEYHRQSEWILKHPAVYSSRAAGQDSVYPVIDPLLNTKWGDRIPFSSLCPLDGKIPSNAGSVATAMAQIMRHYSWPERGRGSVSYECSTLEEPQTVSVNFDESVYDWANMLDEYEANYTSEQVTAVATLIRDCAVATRMQFGSMQNVAGYDALTALAENFAYNPATMKQVRLADYSSEEANQLVVAELEAGRPVYFTGEDSSTGSRAFVIDGWNADGYAHINWGNSGYNDGYFLLSALDYKTDGYNSNQRMITGIQPVDDTTPAEQPEMWAQGNLIVAETTEGFVFRTSDGNFINNSVSDGNFEISVKFVSRSTEQEYIAPDFVTIELAKGESIRQIADNFTLACPDGNYKVSLVYRLVGKEDWTPFRHVPYGSTSYVYATVADGKVSYSNEDNVVDIRVSDWKYEKIMNPFLLNPISFSIANKAEKQYEDTLHVALCDSLGQSRVIYTFLPSLKAMQTKEVKFNFGATKEDSTFTDGVYSMRVLSADDIQFGDAQEVVLDTLFNDEGLDGSKLKYHILSDSLKTCEVIAGNYKGSIVIPEKTIIGRTAYTVTGIQAGAFNTPDGATSVVIPKTVTAIDFYQNFTYTVDTITVSEQNPVYKSVDGLVFSKDGKSLLRYPGGRVAEKYLIPETVSTIGRGAFYGSKIGLVTLTNTVTTIEANAFEYSEVTMMYIPETVTSIGKQAFAYMNNCTEIRMDTKNPNYMVFNGAILTRDMVHFIQYPAGKRSSLFIVPEVVQQIDEMAFAGAKLLTGIQLPSTLTTVGERAFYGCSGLSSVEIPKNVTYIAKEAFAGCSALQTVSLGQKVSAIGASAFNTAGADSQGALAKVTSLNTVPPTLILGENETFTENDYANAVLYVKDGCREAYLNAEGWKKFNTIVELAPEVHDLQYRITSDMTCEVIPGNYTGVVIIPNTVTIKDQTYSVTSIAANCFTDEDGAVSVTIPRTVTEIAMPNFAGSVKEIIVAEFNKNYSAADGVLYNLNQTELIRYPEAKMSADLHFNVPYSVKKIGPMAFLSAKLTSINMPNGIEEIDSIAFAKSMLETVNLPMSVNKIGRGAFFGLENCAEFYVNYSNTTFAAYDGVLYNKVTSTLVQYPIKKRGGMYSFIDGTINVGPEAFMGNTNIERLVINPSLENIGDNAFNGCTGIVYLDVPSNVVNVGREAFANCSGLVTIWLGRGVKSVGALAFIANSSDPATSSHNGMLRISCNNPVPPVMEMENGFAPFGKYDYDIVPLYVPYGCRSVYEKAEGWKLFRTIVEMEEEKPYTFEATGVGEGMITLAAKNLSGTVEVPESFELYGEEYKVTSIADGAFKDCAYIKHLVFSKYVRNIGKQAFYGCKSLLSITIEGEDTAVESREAQQAMNIAAQAFESCNSINKIVVDRPVPPVLESDNVFSTGIYKSATVYVPEYSVDSYKADRIWKYFYNIEGDSTLGIFDTVTNGAGLRVVGNTIFVDGGAATVYNLNGAAVAYSVDGCVEGLDSGIYIVRVNSQTYKVMIK